MQELRLIGVHEDGEHLLLAGPDGTRFRLPLDEPLRAAARRDRPRLGQLQIEIEGGLRPREVQALIRSGLSAREVADRSGWSVEKVRRFEGPVLAEREHIATRARGTVLSHDGFDETLADRAAERLRGRGVDPASVTWDSHRHDSGHWVVSATFAAGGRQRTASWRFDPQTRQLRAQNDDARWLGEDDRGTPAGPIPAPHVAGARSGPEEVFDVTAPAGPAGRGRPALHESPAQAEEDELTESLRAHYTTLRGRRGRRRSSSPSQVPGAQQAPLDALPLVPLAADPAEVGPPPDRPRAAPEDAAQGAVEEATAKEAATAEAAQAEEPESEPEPGPHEADEAPAARPAASGRKGRRSVPSWDDVVFGTRTRPSDDAGD